MIYRILRKGEVRVNKNVLSLNINSKRVMRCVSHRFALLSGKKRRFRHICKRWRRWRTSSYMKMIISTVLNKPSGTAVHGGSGLSFGVIEGLRALRPEARFLELVHRLDRDTSGVLLVAKNARRCVLCMSNYVKKECKRLPGAGARSVAVACEERSSAVIEKYSAKRRTYRACQSGRQTVGNTL